MKKFHIDTSGEAFVFDSTSISDSFYGSDISKLFSEALIEMKFTGTCEFYSGDTIVIPDQYVVGLLLRNEKNKTPELSSWQNFEEVMKKKALEKGINYKWMEFVTKRGLNEHFILHGLFQFENGVLGQVYPCGDINDIRESHFYENLISSTDTSI